MRIPYPESSELESLGWLSVNHYLPLEGEWVIVLRDEQEDSKFWAVYWNKPRWSVIPARLYDIDEEGYPSWYTHHTSFKFYNVTHYMRLPETPNIPYDD